MLRTEQESESFKLDLKREGIKPGSAEISLRAALQCLRGDVLVGSLSLPFHWIQGQIPKDRGGSRVPMEVHLHHHAQQGNRQQELQKALGILYLHLSSTFDSVSWSVLMEKLAAHGLDWGAVSWVKKNV